MRTSPTETENQFGPAPTSSPRPLSILLVVEPGVDGAFRHVESLATFLINRQQVVHLAYSDKRGSRALQPFVEFVQKQGGQTLNLAVSNYPEFGDLPALFRLWKLARNISPDIIHSHSSKAGGLARMLALMGIPARFFYTPHAYFGLSGQKGFRIFLFNCLESLFGRIGFTINISHDEQKFALHRLGLSPSRCFLINNPVEATKFSPATLTNKNHIRRKLGLPLESRVLGSMGRLSFQKDPETLYRAFAQTRQEGLDLYLLHVGKGDLTEQMKLLAGQLGISQRIVRIPYLECPQEFFAATDALIMTSRYEGFWPMVMLEALASDLPVISSTGPGTSDIGEAGLSHCWTAPVGDTRAFAQKITDWHQDLDCVRPINHRQIVIDRFSEESSYGRLLQLYRQK